MMMINFLGAMLCMASSIHLVACGSISPSNRVNALASIRTKLNLAELGVLADTFLAIQLQEESKRCTTTQTVTKTETITDTVWGTEATSKGASALSLTASKVQSSPSKLITTTATTTSTVTVQHVQIVASAQPTDTRGRPSANMPTTTDTLWRRPADQSPNEKSHLAMDTFDPTPCKDEALKVDNQHVLQPPQNVPGFYVLADALPIPIPRAQLRSHGQQQPLRESNRGQLSARMARCVDSLNAMDDEANGAEMVSRECSNLSDDLQDQVIEAEKEVARRRSLAASSTSEKIRTFIDEYRSFLMLAGIAISLVTLPGLFYLRKRRQIRQNNQRADAIQNYMEADEESGRGHTEVEEAEMYREPAANKRPQEAGHGQSLLPVLSKRATTEEPASGLDLMNVDHARTSSADFALEGHISRPRGPFESYDGATERPTWPCRLKRSRGKPTVKEISARLSDEQA